MDNRTNHGAMPGVSKPAAGRAAAVGFPNVVIASLVDQTKSYLTSEAGIEVTLARRVCRSLKQLNLRQSTAVIDVGGDVGAKIAFSFPDELVDVLYRRLTAGLAIPADAEALYRREAVTEMTNIVIGNCTARFAADGGRVSMSPPVLLEAAKPIPRMNNAVFDSVSLVTPHGCFDINLVGPCDMFDAHLNYIQ